MDRMIRYTILGTIAGVILAFNMYHADYKLLVAQVGTIVLVALWAIQICRAGLNLPYSLKNPMILFLVICALSFILSPHKLVSGQELYKVGTWVVFGMIVAAELALPNGGKTANQGLQLRHIINVWLVCAGIIAMYGILQFFGIDFMKFELPHHRIVSVFGNPTLLAGFLAMTLPVALAKIFTQKKILIYRVLTFALIALILSALLLTRSRAGIFVAMVSVFILGLRLQKINIKSAVLIIAGILGVILVLSLITSSRHIIIDTIMRKTVRFDIWGNTLQLAAVNPIFGTGIGTFGLYFPKVVTEDILRIHFVGVEFVNHAHSEYLEILAEMGVVGLAAFLAVAGACIVRAWRFLACHCEGNLGNNLNGLFVAFIAILLTNIVSVDLRYTSTGLFFWMIAGILSWREK